MKSGSCRSYWPLVAIFALVMPFVPVAEPQQPPAKPRFAVYRDHAVLIIRDIRNVPLPGGVGCDLLVYRVEPLTTRLTLWRGTNNSPSKPIVDNSEIRIADFFRADPLSAGAAVLVPHAGVNDIVSATDRNHAVLQDLLTLFDGQRVFAYDMTRLRPTGSHAKVHNRWESNDLVAEPQPLTQDAVVISFRHDDVAGPKGGTMRLLQLPNGDATASASASVRYVNAKRGTTEAISIVTDRTTADLLRPILMQAGSWPYAGLDVLLRSGAIYGADVALAGTPAAPNPAPAPSPKPPQKGAPPSKSAPPSSKPAPPPSTTAPAAKPPAPAERAEPTATGVLFTQLRDLRRRLPDPVVSAKSSDDVTTSVIDSYRTFIAAIPHRLLAEPRAWEQINQVFLDTLPWESFFKYVSFANSFGRLEYIRSQLDTHDPTRNIGEEFIFSYADRFLRRYPVERSQLDARVGIAEGFFRMAARVVVFRGKPLTVDTVIAEYYQLVGRFLASDVADSIEHWQKDSKRKLSDREYEAYGTRLAQLEVYLPERKGVTTKVADYAARGDLNKLWQRTMDEFMKRPSRARDFSTAAYRIHSPRMTANRQMVFYDVAYTSSGQEHPLGHLILVQPNARLHYGYTVKKGQTGYTAADLRQRFNGSHYYVITSGSYTEGTGRTSGLSAENGVIKNFYVTHKMDGFVAIRNGAVYVFDLEGGFSLPNHSEIIRPIRSLRDFHTFISWLRQEGISGFQTHLLVKNDRSAIDPSKTNETRRERRFFLSLRDTRGQRMIAFLDIPNSEAVDFIEATAIIIRLMHKTYHYTIDSAVNLDTGSYDVLKVQADDGNAIYKTAVDMDRATNLVVVYE